MQCVRKFLFNDDSPPRMMISKDQFIPRNERHVNIEKHTRTHENNWLYQKLNRCLHRHDWKVIKKLSVNNVFTSSWLSSRL